MYRNKKISVVVPAYNEEQLISVTLSGIPEYVDSIYVINDGSTDGTGQIIRALALKDPRIVLIDHEKNKGVGSAIVDGYLRSIDAGMDIVAVMAGDDQMDPAYLPTLLDPIVDGKAEYTKGNRLFDSNFKKGMSVWRLMGNTILTILTKFASGCWNISDPQNGYTAISREALIRIDPNQVFTWYGYCNDIIMRLHAKKCRILDVPIPARYGNEKSKIRYPVYMARISRLLVINFITRMAIKRADGSRIRAFITPIIGSLMIILSTAIMVLMSEGRSLVNNYETDIMSQSLLLISLPFLGVTLLLYNRAVNVATGSLKKHP